MSISVLGIFVADLAFYGKIPKVGQTILGKEFVVGPGGKGSNQAVAAAKLGTSVNFITKVGNDDYGEMAYKIYKESNVGTDFVYISDKHDTGVAAILLDKETGENAISVVPGAAAELTIKDVDNAKDLIKNSSIFLTQLEVPIEVAVYALKIAKENNVTTILNPAPASKLDKEVFHLIDYFTPNESEASFYVSSDIVTYEDAKKNAAEILNLGVKNVLITLGDKGVYFQNKSQNYFEPALKLGEKVIDTTGAGDAFNGSFATALSENKTIKEAIKFANFCAGISTTRIGTAKSMPKRDEIEKLL